LLRGKKAMGHNNEVEASGVGQKWEVRKTDLDEKAAHMRYKTFKESTYDSLTSLREVFHYHFINAQGTIIEVQQRIINELKYQSSLELDEATYDRISSIPLATKLSQHARQLLVNRLDSYEKFHTDLFEQVVELIKTKFIPIIEKHSISGLTYINSEDSVFDDLEGLLVTFEFKAQVREVDLDSRIRRVERQGLFVGGEGFEEALLVAPVPGALAHRYSVTPAGEESLFNMLFESLLGEHPVDFLQQFCLRPQAHPVERAGELGIVDVVAGFSLEEDSELVRRVLVPPYRAQGSAVFQAGFFREVMVRWGLLEVGFEQLDRFVRTGHSLEDASE